MQPRIVVTLGEDAREFLNSIRFPLSVQATAPLGSVEQWTPTIEVLAVPDIDASLNESEAKQAFWSSFKTLGDWYEQLPPY